MKIHTERQREGEHHATMASYGDERTPSTFIKYILFFVNMLFWFLSVIILAIGIYVMVEKREFYGKLTDLYYDPAVLFVVLGGLMFIVTFTGCLGALRENTCLLCVNVAIIVALLVLEIACGIFGFINSVKVEQTVDEKLRNAIMFYRDPTKQDLHFIIDTAQIELGCCGSKSYIDWEANIYFNCSSPSVSACGVPFSCCRTEELRENRQCGYGIEKLSFQERADRISTQGCLTKTMDFLKNNLALIGGLSFAILVLQILTVCLAMVLRSQILQVKETSGNTK